MKETKKEEGLLYRAVRTIFPHEARGKAIPSTNATIWEEVYIDRDAVMKVLDEAKKEVPTWTIPDENDDPAFLAHYIEDWWSWFNKWFGEG